MSTRKKTTPLTIFHTLAVMAAVALLVMLGACSSNQSETSKPADTGAALQNDAGTDSTSATVHLDPGAVEWAAMDLDGTLHHYTEWVGRKPVVINFWGSWCPPCRREIPELVKMYKEFSPQGVQMVSLAGGSDTPDKVRSFSSQHGMKWTMLMANQHALQQFGITGFPTTIFIDKTGKEVGRFVGPRSYDMFKKAFESIL